MKDIKKIFRFYEIYGIGRTVIKVAGRTRLSYLNLFFPKIFLSKKKKEVSLIGCGQFGFSTISYFLLKNQGNKFLECYDISKQNEKTTAGFWGYETVHSPYVLLLNPKSRYIYIASNHYTHSEYAIIGLENNKVIYLEKPISVNYQQFSDLLLSIEKHKGEIYVGYNRPFSGASNHLKKVLPKKQPMSLNCFVIGHKIGLDHWYRNPAEGTRVCGNMGHWIDLSVHLMGARQYIPEKFDISISYSNKEEPDDNLDVSIVTDFGDLISIILSAREEPFEGINETINFQSENVIAKIDDFREMKIWENEKYKKYKYKPKDVGHAKAINQPFDKKKRDFNEVIISTILMLEITDMVKKLEEKRTVFPIEIKNKISFRNKVDQIG